MQVCVVVDNFKRLSLPGVVLCASVCARVRVCAEHDPLQKISLFRGLSEDSRGT